mgnify:CR=1 FL=1
MRPLALGREDVDPAEIEKERTILREAALKEGKPENIIDKMVEGRLKNFYKDVDDQHMINPEFRILHQFTSEDDVFKIYQAYSKL